MCSDRCICKENTTSIRSKRTPVGGTLLVHVSPGPAKCVLSLNPGPKILLSGMTRDDRDD